MNIVDLLKDQLSGQVAKQLGGSVGVNETDLSKVLGAGLPGLLGGLGKLASSKQGAGKIADAIGGMDSSLFGNLAGMLTGGLGKQGGGMLGNLFGSQMVDGLAASISKLTGINAGIVKTVLGYLAPIVLGSIGSTLGGSKPSAAGMMKLFDDQKSNIAGAMPSGFSLDSIPGFQALSSSSSPSPSTSAAPPPASGNKFLVPAILLAAIGGLIYYVVGQVPKPADKLTEPAPAMTAPAMSGPAMTAPAALPELPKLPSVDADKMLPELPEFDLSGLQTKVTSMLDGLGGKLSGATDAASAEEILPDLTGYAEQIGTVSESLKVLPKEAQSSIGNLIKSQLEKLDPIFEKFTSIPGIGDSVKAVIEQIKTALLQMVGQ